MTSDIDRLAQNILMECNGDANSALRALASRVIALNDYAERLENRREREASFGFNRWQPRKRVDPLVLDSPERVGQALDIDQTASPNG